MSSVVAPLLVVVLLLNFFLLGTSRVRSAINASALQGVVLGLLAFVAHGHLDWRGVLVAVGATVLKGIIIPAMLVRALRDVAMRREIEPIIGFIPSLLFGALGTGLSLLFADTLPLAPEHADSLLVPTCLSTVLTGFLLLTTRRKAIVQVVGYLILENGVFIMGLALLEALPLLVEAGVLLDLFVGIFVMGIIVNHIHREFGSVDAQRLDTLRE